MTFQWQDKRWHVRLFLWAEPIVAKFFDSCSVIHGYSEQYEINTNLCLYMRTILLWLPLALFANLATLAMAITTVTYIPSKLFGWRGWGLTVLVAAAGIGLVVLLFALHYRFHERRGSRPPKPVESPRDDTPGFRTAVREWARKTHEGICPGITITVDGGRK